MRICKTEGIEKPIFLAAEIYPPIGLLTEVIMNGCVSYFRAKKIVCLFFGRTNSFDKGDRYQACISAVA